jgi:hypothetical protein
MPAKPLMSWEGSPQYRWRKMVNGIPLEISCKRLGLARSMWTKEGSYQAANEWLRRKLSEIQKVEPEPDADQAEVVNTITNLMDWAASNAPDELKALGAAKAALLKNHGDDHPVIDSATVAGNLEIARLNGIHVPEDLDPTILQHLFGNRRIYQDRLKRHTKVKKHQTLGYLLDAFLGDLRLKLSPQSYDEIHRYLKSIPISVWVQDAGASSIGPAVVTNHYRWLLSCGLDAATHNKRIGFFRRFVKWLFMEGHIDSLPRNNSSSDHRMRVEHKEVKKYRGIDGFVDALKGDEKAWALLCLNCGMTAVDLGKLFWQGDSIDLWMKARVAGHSLRVCGVLDPAGWTITRRRSKTGKQKQTPTVTYKLWPETIQAIESLGPVRTGLVFVHESGTPMRYDLYDEVGGSRSGAKRVDYFGSAWRGKKIPLGKLRSIAAHALSRNLEYRSFRSYFLGHAPRTVGERHYHDEHEEPFFGALAFIRTELLGSA